MFDESIKTVLRPTVAKIEFDSQKALLDTPAAVTRPMKYHQAMIDKTGPGERTHELHIGSADLETKAILLAQGGVEDVIARICMDVESNTAILRKMFPTKEGGYLDTTNPHFTATSLQEEIKSVMRGYAEGSDIEKASMLYVAFIADLLKGTAVIQPSKPLVCTTQSLNIFVDPSVIEEQVRVNSLMMTLDSVNLSLNLGRIRRLTPKFFIAEACNLLSELGIALVDDKKHLMYLHDVQQLVSYYHHPDRRFTHLPIDVRDDINLKSLAGNLSFTIYALTMPTTGMITTPAHTLNKALAYVASVLNKSPRMEIIPIDQIKKYISHMQIKSPKGQVVGGVSWRNMNGQVRTQASRFIPMNRSETIHFQQQQRIVEEVFDSVGSKLFSSISGHKMGEVAHEILTNIATTEKKPYNLTIGLTPSDLMHYAVACANATYLRMEENGDNVMPSLVYEVHHDDNYLGSVGTYGKRSLLKSAAETIILIEDNVQNVEVAPRVQGIKDEARRGFLYGDPTKLCTPLHTPMVFNTDILGKQVRLKITIEELIGIHENSQIQVHIPIVNRMVMDNYYQLIKFLRSQIKSKSEVPEINTRTLEMMLCMHVNRTMTSVYSSTAGKAIVKSVIFKILETIPAKDLAPYKLDLYRSERQIDMYVWSALVMLMKMGILTFDQTKLFRDMITSKDMVQALLMSSDFDFSEV